MSVDLMQISLTPKQSAFLRELIANWTKLDDGNHRHRLDDVLLALRIMIKLSDTGGPSGMTVELNWFPIEIANKNGDVLLLYGNSPYDKVDVYQGYWSDVFKCWKLIGCERMEVKPTHWAQVPWGI